MKKKILIGFEKEIKYPHLLETVGYLEENAGCKYFYFRERGYFTDESFKITFKNLLTLKAFRVFWTVFGDYVRLLKVKRRDGIDSAIAVDNLSYVVASYVFAQVTLWSHDFVTNDQDRAKTWYQRLIRAKTKRALLKNKKIIIQSESRLKTFLDSYDIKNESEISVFLLPVSLKSVSVTDRATQVELSAPVLLQIGGINKFRSNSHLLLQDYGLNHNKYRLLLHGYFEAEILNIIESMREKPMTSTLELTPEDVQKIIRKCDIGFISYAVENKNFYFIAHASGQFVEFLRLGKPVVFLGSSELGQFIMENGLGASIDKIDQLGDAIQKINLDYENISSHCTDVFNRIFNIDNYLPQLRDWVEK